MPEVRLNAFTKADWKTFHIAPTHDLDRMIVLEGYMQSGNAAVLFELKSITSQQAASFITTARIADAMSGAIIKGQLEFDQKPLGPYEDAFGIFERMRGKVMEAYMRSPGATLPGWVEFSKDLTIPQMMKV